MSMNTGIYDVTNLSPRIGTGMWCVLSYAYLLPLAITLGVAAGGCATATGGSGSYEMTELHKAAERNDVQTIAKWFAKGKSPDGVYNERGNWHEGAGIHGKTALMFAAERGNFASAKLLIDGGANIYLEAGKPGRDDKQSAFDYAVEGRNPKIVRLLWEKSDKKQFRKNSAVNMVRAYSNLCSSLSSREVASEIVYFLLDHVVDTRTATQSFSAIASNGQCTPEIRLLLEHGVMPSTSMLNSAANGGQPDLIVLYLKYGAKVNALGQSPIGLWPVTPLIAAAERNPQPEVVQVLLKTGADPNGQDRYGRTPLMAVVCGGSCITRPNPICEKRMSVLDILLKNGAKKDIPDHNGKTALDCVDMYGATDAYRDQKKALLGLSAPASDRTTISACVGCKLVSTDEISPHDLKSKLWSSYRLVRSYHDKGKAIFRSLPKSTQRFETYFSREHGIKLTWTEDFEGLPSVQYQRFNVMWGSEKCLQNYIQLASEKIVHGCQVFKYYTPVGYNKTTQWLVPGFLYGHPEDFSESEVKSETVEVHTLPDNSKAYVLVTERSDGWITRLWVDANRFYVRRFERAGWKSAPDSSLETIVDIETVEIDSAVTPEMVSFDPPVWSKTGIGDLDEGVKAFYREDYAKAVTLFTPLVLKDRPEAMYFLAQMYAGGKGVNQNWNQAYALMKKAAANGYKPAHAGLVGLMQFGFLIDEVKDMPAEALKQEYYAQLKAALEYERCNTDLFKAVEQFIETNKEYEADWGRWQKQKAGCSWSSLDSYTSPLSVTDLSDFRATPRVEVRNNPGESDPFTRRWFERYDDAASTRSLS